MSSSIPLGQCAASFPNYSGEQPRKADRLSQRTAFQVPHPDEWLMFGSTLLSISENLRINFLPSQPAALLASPSAPANLAAGHPGFPPPDGYPLSPAGTSSLLRIHLPPHTASIRLESPLEFHYPLRTHRAERYEAFPSY